MSKRLRNVARRRLGRDLIELQRANILSIAAHPIDNNIFEWHVNIKPTDGVYSGVYFHLIMVFPESYPANPPTVKICTPIHHPNIFDSFLCLSMLRSYTGSEPYEGWSGAYSATSILMQLQSFLFAEKIDQDGGYQANAQLSDQDVKHSLSICKSFKCKKCKHNHNNPWPKVKGPPEALIKVFPTDPESGHVVVQGSACQTTHTYWVGAYGEFGCNYGQIMYEAYINWTGDKWKRDNIRGGLCRFGFGTQYASVCGRSADSFGYGGTGMFSWNNNFDPFGESFAKGDTITCAVDFDTQTVYFAKNGKIMRLPGRKNLFIPQNLNGALLYPILSFKNSRSEFNFGMPKKPCKWLIQNGFKTLNEVAIEQATEQGYDDDDRKNECTSNVNWHSEYIIPELWLVIFEGLELQGVFSTRFVCKKWCQLIHKYNIMERNEIYCYYTKGKLGQRKGGKILGIGLSITPAASGWGTDIKSQMDILSLNSWCNGCRIGVWGEKLTHFLPLVMNKRHADLADGKIKEYLQNISKMVYTKRDGNPNEFERCIERSNCLQLVDTLVSMMNQIVVQFVMGSEDADPGSVSMVMCEKVVLGYCALHHLLLYLQSQNRRVVTKFANQTVHVFVKRSDGSNKNMCRDLGKLLIYLMISSKYQWNDVAKLFIEEVFTRNVRWMFQDPKYSKYNTTKVVNGRLKETFNAAKISRRLVMFQVWFMKNNALETLQGYNHRLGRPDIKVRNGVVHKTKFILNSSTWWDYFNELEVTIKDEKSIDQLLRFAIYNSKRKGYHNARGQLKQMNPPHMRVNSKRYDKPQCIDDGRDENQIGLKIRSGGRGWGNVKASGWRGRGRGAMTMVNRGRGRGANQVRNKPQIPRQPPQQSTFHRGRGGIRSSNRPQTPSVHPQARQQIMPQSRQYVGKAPYAAPIRPRNGTSQPRIQQNGNTKASSLQQTQQVRGDSQRQSEPAMSKSQRRKRRKNRNKTNP
eukprot:292819_1